MDLPLISIIIPVYQAEQHINSCIDSILQQSYVNWQLVLVDDGSSDSSPIICDQYAQRDSRINVYHIDNSGVSSARNFGMTKCIGEWLCFIDSDDSVCQNYLEEFYKGIQCNPDVSFVLSGYCNVYTNGSKKNPHVFPNTLCSKNILSILELSENLNIINSPVSKLFQLKIIEENHLKFDSTMSYGEDHIFVLSYIKYVDTIYVSDLATYNYFHRNNNSLTSSLRDFSKYILYLKKLKLQYGELNFKFKCLDYKILCHKQLKCHIIDTINLLMESSECDKWSIFKFLYDEFHQLYKISPISRTRRLINCLMCFPPKTAYYMILFFCKIKQIIKHK